MCADGDKDGVKALFQQSPHILDPAVQSQVHSGGYYFVDLPLDHIGGQAVIGHSEPHHPAGHRLSFQDRGLVSHADQVEGGRQPGGTGPHYRHPFSLGFYPEPGPGGRNLVRVFGRPVGHESFQSHDVDGCIYLAPVAGLFATMIAYPAADGWERILLLDGEIRVRKTALADEGDVPLCPLVNRAGTAARGGARLLNGIDVGNCLGIGLVHRAMLRQFVAHERGRPGSARPGQRHGADGLTVATVGASVHVNVTGAPLDFNLLAGVPWTASWTADRHPGARHDGDVGVLDGLQHLGDGRERVFLSGKRLGVAQEGRPLHQRHRYSRIGQVQRSLDGSKVTADDQCSCVHAVSPGTRSTEKGSGGS